MRYKGIMLAPMAGITNWPMRLICKRMGCSFAYTEMVSAKGLSYGNKSKAYLDTHPDEGKVGVQIFGKDPSIMADISKWINDEYSDKVAEININMGCPAAKIVRNGEGSALLNDLPLAGRIMEAVAKVSRLPVTVKCRKGFHDEQDVSTEMARIAEASGMSMICIHGRSATQGYSGYADWNCVSAAKQACHIPVIGNGDVDSCLKAEDMMRLTGCDGVMVGRAAMGNPWLFGDKKPDPSEIFRVAMEHLDLEIGYRGEKHAVTHLRKLMSAYVSGMPNASTIRAGINTAVNRQQMKNLLFYELNIQQ